MTDILQSIKHGVIVSCQADGDDPFNHPEYLAAFARTAELGGAVGIRARGVENILAIRATVQLPIFGITKGTYADGSVLITPDFRDVDQIIRAGADIVALDVTKRVRPNGMSGFQFLEEVRRRYDGLIMADVSTYEEGIEAAERGANFVASTLSGYTSYTEEIAGDLPDFDLVERLSSDITVPVIAEGRIWNPAEAVHALKCGAYAIVVGTAITRPRIITQRFVEALRGRSQDDSPT